MTRHIRELLTGVAVAAVAVGVCESAMADQIIYWTNFSGRQLVKADITTLVSG